MKQLYAVTGLMLAAGASMFGQFNVDHFKCYTPHPASSVMPATVQLRDQFYNYPTAVIGSINRLCNPARKNHNGRITDIRWPDDHLTLHNMTVTEPAIPRVVRIRNQFGDQTITTQEARVLAVPTQKTPHGPPQAVDHFTCYTVSDGQPLNVQVGLKDQFFAANQTLLQPMLFCNPARKVHGDVVTPAANPNDHLTCYNLNPLAFPRAVGLRNQFGQFQFNAYYADMSCVPTQKLSWQVTHN